MKAQQRAQLQREQGNNAIPHDTPAPGVEPGLTSPNRVDAALTLVGLQGHKEVDLSTHTQPEQRAENPETPSGGRGQRRKRPSPKKLAASEAALAVPPKLIPAPADHSPEPSAIEIHSDASDHAEKNTLQPNSGVKRAAVSDTSSPLSKVLCKEMDSKSLQYQLILQATLDASNT